MPSDLVVVRGAGDIATGTIYRLIRILGYRVRSGDTAKSGSFARLSVGGSGLPQI